MEAFALQVFAVLMALGIILAALVLLWEDDACREFIKKLLIFLAMVPVILISAIWQHQAEIFKRKPEGPAFF